MDKRSGRRAELCGKRVALAVAATFLPWGGAYALPTGEQVVTPGVSVTRPTGQSMQIDQGVPKGIINWQGFSIGASEHVNVTQPNASAALLNRVVGNSPSEIFGRLTANGQVFLVNNAGVLFAPGASVSAGALVASTLSITDQNFLNPTNGRYEFYNPGNAGSVVNQGSIITAGGYTALIGPQVRNDGVIIANAGKVALGAGDRVSLTMFNDSLVSINVDEAAYDASVINTGTIQADGGTVMLKASSLNALLDTVINTSGVLRASGLGLQNGEIVLHGGDAGTVQISGLVQAESGRIEIDSGGPLNVGATVCCSPTTVIAAIQDIEAGSIMVGGGAQVVGNAGSGTQIITTPGTLLVRGGILSGDVGLFHNGSGEQRISAGNLELRGGTGANTGAFINSTGGGDQHITVPGTIAVTGGAGGTASRAGIVASASQTIDGNPDIVLTGGAGGGVGNASNNVFLQGSTDAAKLQRINARTIAITAGAGADAAATINAARQEISTTGNVSLLGGAGSGPVNGVRIGGAGGPILGPTNLTLNVGGSLLLSGGTVNGASLGSSGASTQANTIAVNAAGDIRLASLGAGARIGSSNQIPVPAGNITLTAGSLGSLQLGGGTAIRANGPITLTANSLTNAGTITNGGGTNSANLIFNANAFNLAAGNIQGGAGAVILRPRTGTNSFGIESAGMTTLTNADIARINTSNFVVFGSGIGTTFTGDMTIGENVQVNGGGKHLAFFRSSSPTAPGTITIGAQGVATMGVTTMGDVIVGAGSGAIVSNGGRVIADEVQLRAATGIGSALFPVQTAASALAVLNTGGVGSAFVSEADDVTLRNVTLDVGGMNNNINNFVSGSFDLAAGGAVNVAGVVQSIGTMNIGAGGALNVIGAGMQDALLLSGGGQTITAQSVSVAAQDGRRAAIQNDLSGEQTITTGALSVSGGSAVNPPLLSGILHHGSGAQTINASSVQVQGASVGAGNGIFIRATSGDQRLNVGGDISIAAGTGGDAWIQGSVNGQQTIHARNISMSNALGGTNSFAALQAGHQDIHATGDVRLTGGATASTQGGVRLGGLRFFGAETGTDLDLHVGGDLVLTGGTAPDNGASIGTSGSLALPNNIYIEAGSVGLNAGSASGAGARIGSGANALAGGSIEIHADRGIELNGTTQSAVIRTLGNVTLDAASISQASNGFIIANTLTTTTSGVTNLAGPNDIARFSGTSGGALTLVDAGALQVTGIATTNDAITLTTGSLTNTGAITNGGGASNQNAIFNADAFNLAGGTISAGAAAVILRPRTGTNSFGIEAAGMTTLTNADIASIDTTNFVVFGSGMGTTFTGNMTIGQNAQVNGGGKHLAFFRSTNPGGSTTIGSQGVATTGDVIVSAGGGAILSNGGAVAGDEVQLRASQGIGTPGARVQTAANALAVNNAGPTGAFVSEADDVVLRNVDLTVGGINNNFGNFVGNGGGYNFAANGALTVMNGVGTSNGFITLTAASLANAGVITNGGGGTGVVVLIADAFNLAGGTIAGGNAGVVIRPRTGANSFGIEASGQTTLTNADIDSISTTNFVVLGSFLDTNFTGSMTVGENAQVNGGTKNLAFVRSNLAPGTMTIGSQGVTSAGDVMIGAGGGAIVSHGGMVRADEVQLTAAQDIGAPFARVQTAANALAVNTAGGASVSEADSVTLRTVAFNVGGVAQVFGNSVGGVFDLGAGGSVDVAGPVSSGVMSVSAGGAITESPTGSITANTLSTFSGGSTLLTGPNQVSNFGASAGGDLTLNNTGALNVTNLSAANATLTSTGNVTLGGPWNSSGATSIAVASDLNVNNFAQSNGPMTLNVDGAVRVVGSGVQDASLTSFGGQTINARSMEVTSRDGRFVSVRNSGPSAQTISLANGAGLDVQVLGSGGFAQVSADPGGSQTINVTNGDHVNVNGAGGAAMIASFGGPQTISITGSGANAIRLGAAGSLGPSSVFGGVQNITAGVGGESGSITIVGGNANATFTGISSGQILGGTQTVSTSGTLRIAGGNAPNQPPSGFATGLFHNGSGEQRVNAASLEMQGGSSGVNNLAIIISSGGALTITPGDQVINVAGNAGLAGGSGGTNNTAIIVSFADQTVSAGTVGLQGGTGGVNNGAFINIANPGGNQLLNIAGDLSIVGGAGGNAGITGSPTFQQTIFANDISLTNAAAGGNNSVGFILGGHQAINATGDVTLTARASGGTLPGVRIGGLAGAAPTATNLMLNVGGHLELTGGTAANNGVGIGSTAAAGPALANSITINTGGSVILNSGTEAGTGARIGSSAATGAAPGNIIITAGSGIELNGTVQGTAIRTLDNVTLNAASISEAANGLIVANSLTSNTSGNANLAGPNQVANFSASAGGDLTLNNTGTLNVSSLFANNATLANSGNVTLSGPWNTFGATSISVASDLNVNSFVQSSGPMTLDVDGAVRVVASGVQDASLTSFGGQTIDARSLEVTSLDGRFASVRNTGPSAQTANLSNGAGLDVQTLSPGGFAQVSADAGGSQTINVVNGDHINVNGAAGSAALFAIGGTQSLSITGNGANRITVGSLGAMGPSNVGGGLSQTVTAGLAGEQGSITIVGSDAVSALAGFVSNPSVGGTQTISTPGTISIAGGRAPSQLGNFPAGIFHNGTGQQTITAGALSITGGPSGNNNAALINVPGGGVPANAGPQVVNVSGDINIAGGAGGNAGILGGRFNQQTIHADNIHLTNSALGGNNSVGFIQGGHQEIHAAGDVTLTARASGGDLPGVRIGGTAGNNASATDLKMFIGGDLVLTGGSAANNGVGVGSTAAAGPALANTIDVRTGGSVILNSGVAPGTGARIGSSVITGAAPGNIIITAGSGIELNGAAQSTVIRTLDTVTLVADHITEAANGFIVADTLTTTTGGNTSLTGPNAVSGFNATSTGGSVSLNNTGVLDVTGLVALNDATITNIGDVTVSGTWTAGGTSTITVGSDILLNAPMVSGDVMLTANDGAILQAPSGSITADTLTTVSSGETRLLGPNDVDVFSADSSGGLTLNNTSTTFTLGDIETHGGAFSVAQAGDMTVTSALAFENLNLVVGGSLALLGGSAPGSAAEITGQGPMHISVGGDVRLAGGSGDGAFARILGYSDVNLTVGGFLTLNAGSGQGAWARVQTASRDSVIYLNFPNLTSGGYFVNGVEGLLRDGHTGFLSGNGVAAPGHQLITTYGEQ